MIKRAFSTLYTVYGGQFGSEGKGQITRFIATKSMRRRGNGPDSLIAYRIGGPNAGHTFYVNDKKIVTCQIPGPMFLHHGILGVLGPEAVISLPTLEKELNSLIEQNESRKSLYPQYSNLMIDRSAVIISEEQQKAEGALVKNIGSTGKGVGAATADKVLRNDKTTTALNSDALKTLITQFDPKVHIIVTDTINAVKNWTRGTMNYDAIIEGTQGSGLSLHTSGYFPFTTSRECTPQGIWAGCGLHPSMAVKSESVMVIRTYPIRVAGSSGPMNNETNWEVISKQIGREVKEITTVTQNTRRVSEIDLVELKRTVWFTRPDCIALTFLDYIDPEVYKKNPNNSVICREYVENLQKELQVPVSYVSTGEGCVYDWLQ
jgi:adenylosuccinate synthase